MCVQGNIIYLIPTLLPVIFWILLLKSWFLQIRTHQVIARFLVILDVFLYENPDPQDVKDLVSRFNDSSGLFPPLSWIVSTARKTLRFT